MPAQLAFGLHFVSSQTWNIISGDGGGRARQKDDHTMWCVPEELPSDPLETAI
jgi:hypothetical protein